jgi:hypothetical protein
MLRLHGAAVFHPSNHNFRGLANNEIAVKS